MQAEGQAGEGRREGRRGEARRSGGKPGRSDYESAEASLGRRRPQRNPRCQPRRWGGRAGRLPCAQGTGPCGEGEGASERLLPGGRWGRGLRPCHCPGEACWISSLPPRRGRAVGPGRAAGRGCGRTVPPAPLTSAGGGRRGRAREPRRDSLRICVEISSLPFFFSPEPGSICSCDLHFFFLLREANRW